MDNNPNNQQSGSEPPTDGSEAPRSQDTTQQPPQSGPESPAANPQASGQNYQSAMSEESMPHKNPFGEQKRSRKKLLLAFVVGLLVLLIGAAAAAYSLVYQNPQRVVADAVVNAMRADTVTFDGSALLTTNQTDQQYNEIRLTMDGKSTGSDGLMNVKIELKNGEESQEISGSGLVDKDANVYVKVNNVDELVSEVLGVSGELPTSAQPIIEKIDGNWIRFAAADTGELSEEYKKQQECLGELTKKIETDSALTNEVAELYKANQFIEIVEELGSRDGNLGYVIDGDRAKFDAFATGLKDTALYKEVKACDEDFDFEPSDLSWEESEDTQTRLEVWISRFDHELREVKFTANDEEESAEIVVRPVFNEPVTVEAPTEFVPFSELLSDIGGLFTASFEESESGPLFDEVVDPNASTLPLVPSDQTFPRDEFIPRDDPIT